MRYRRTVRLWEHSRTILASALFLLAGFGLSVASISADPPDDAKQLAELGERVESLETARNVLLTVSGGTLVGLVIGWFRLLKKADRLAQKRLEEINESRPRALLQLIAEHEAETRLRRGSHIAIVSESLEVEGVLREHGFRRLKTLPRHAATEDTLATFDAVILDLHKGLPAEEAAQLIERSARDSFLAYSPHPGRVPLPPQRTTFANSPITLYARLLELLRFQEARREE